MKAIKLTFQPSGAVVEPQVGESILEAARRIGERMDSDCGGQKVCGKCRVLARVGEFSPVSREERRLLLHSEIAEGFRLACEARPLADAEVYIPYDSRQVKTLAVGSGAERPVAIDPPVKNYYIELTPPSLEDPAADAERLKEALGKRYGLDGLSIAYPALKALSSTLRQAGFKVTATIRAESVITRVQPGYVPVVLGAAFDMGTTTVAGYLCNLASGETIATDAMTNPQAAYGADVMSRITYCAAREDAARRMQSALVDGLNRMLRNMTAASGPGKGVQDVMEVVLVGNTVMHHLALGLPAGALGVFPFTPALSREMEFRASVIGLAINEAGSVYTLPVVGGFVGADHTAALITEEQYNQDDVTLLIDLGTNGEISVGNRHRLLSASCATGPAFEGAQVRFGMRAVPGAIERVMIDPETKETLYRVAGKAGWSMPLSFSAARGICGSGMVDAVAQMHRAGIINRGGSFEKDLKHPRVRQDGGDGPEYVVAWARETAIGRDITVSAGDVRAILLAKAAVHAGAMVLMAEFGASRVDRVVLAGAFGNYMDKANALALGMLPPCDPEKVYAVGNAAGDGARAALLCRGKRDDARKAAAMAEYVELALHPMFNDEFIASIPLPGPSDG